MRVTDLSTVWVVGQVYEKDLANIRVGSGANITSDAYPGRIFRGRVSYVDPRIDPATRTAQVRIELANPGQVLKIGMYVNVAFGALGLAKKPLPSSSSTQYKRSATSKSSSWLPRSQMNSFCDLFDLALKAMGSIP